MDNLRYPIGKHDLMAPIDAAALAAAIATIRELPARLEAAVRSRDDSQLDTSYRPEGWTVRQVVHHFADSHLNAHTRLRLALTEDAPVIRPYREAAWAELADARSLPLEPSLAILRCLHARWSTLLSALGPAEFARPWIHPDRGQFSVAQLTGLYGWHSRHHLAHITSLIERSGWANSSARVAALAMTISTEDLAGLDAMSATFPLGSSCLMDASSASTSFAPFSALWHPSAVSSLRTSTFRRSTAVASGNSFS